MNVKITLVNGVEVSLKDWSAEQVQHLVAQVKTPTVTFYDLKGPNSAEFPHLVRVEHITSVEVAKPRSTTAF